jgi:hypothetical protein
MNEYIVIIGRPLSEGRLRPRFTGLRKARALRVRRKESVITFASEFHLALQGRYIAATRESQVSPREREERELARTAWEMHLGSTAYYRPESPLRLREQPAR